MTGAAFDRLAATIGVGAAAALLLAFVALQLHPALLLALIPAAGFVAAVPVRRAGHGTAARGLLLAMANLIVLLLVAFSGNHPWASVAALHNLVLAYVLFERAAPTVLRGIVSLQLGLVALSLVLPAEPLVPGVWDPSGRPWVLPAVVSAAALLILIALRDSRRARLEAETKESEASEQLDSLLEALPELVAILDPEGRILDAGGAALLPLEVGSSILEAFAADRRAAVERVLKAAAEGTPGELTAQDAAGEGWFRLRAARTPRGDAVLAVVDDRTSEFRAQARLERAVAASEVAARTRGAILANVSHELRTPLTTIVGLAEVLLEESEDADDPRTEDLEMLVAAGRRMADVVAGLLDLSGGDPAAASPPVVVDVEDLLRSTLQSWEGAAESVGRELRLLASGESLELVVRVDPLRRVVAGLVDHALRNPDPQPVTLGARSTRFRGEEAVRIELLDPADTGASAAADDVFGDDPGARGSGFGLVVAQRLVGRIGGVLESRPLTSGGTVHLVTVPDQKRMVPDLRDRPRVLVVDDVRTNGMVATQLLERLGCSAVWVDSGAEAVGRIARGERWPVILMDLHMPGLDGYEATRRILAAASDPPRVVAVSADDTEETAERCRAVGLEGPVMKPLSEKILLRILEGESWTPSNSEAVVDTRVDPDVVDTLLQDLGDAGFVAELLRMFDASAERRLGEIESALQAHDPGAAGESAHALVTPASSVGARGLSGLSRRMEELCRVGDLDGAALLLPAIREAGAAARSGVAEMLAEIESGARG